jgi:proteasome assembly chaperone (PAC2) family protein
MVDFNEMLTEHTHVELRDPVLVAAFRGWNDAGDAATFAVTHMGRVWSASRVASIDPEEFYDFQVSRPQVKLVEGSTRQITWPQNEFWAAHMNGAEHDVIFLVGTEPNTRWRTFTNLVLDVARRHRVKTAIMLGALLADVPHSRPVQVTGTAADPEKVAELGLQRSRYEGPTGIVGVLHDGFAKAGIDSASLWAAVPHYLAVTPNPKAALALVNKASGLIGATADVSNLERATVAYEQQVAEIVAQDEDVQAYVRLLEERTDEEPSEIDPSKLPSADALAAEVERFLKEKDEPDDS